MLQTRIPKEGGPYAGNYELLLRECCSEVGTSERQSSLPTGKVRQTSGSSEEVQIVGLLFSLRSKKNLPRSGFTIELRVLVKVVYAWRCAFLAEALVPI